MSKYDKASLVMIPSAYKAEKLYSVLPENGNGDFTHDRSTTATRVNKDGLIETVAADVPRLDYPLIDGVVQDCPVLLLEPARTNLMLNSNSFTSWAKEATVTLTANYGISPDGTQNSTRMQMSENDSIYISTTSGLTASVYVKGVQGETIRFSNGSSVVHTLTGQWDRIESYDSGSVSTLFTINTYSGVTARDIELFGAQIEAGSYATSYIPTEGSSVTRDEDVCNGAGNSEVFNDSEGVLYVETKGFTDLLPQSNYIQLSKNGESSATNSLIIQHRNNGYLRVYVGGFNTPDIHFNVNIDFTENHKIAVLYKLNGYKLFIDGVAQNLYLTPNQTVFSGLDNLSFDLRGALSWNGKVKEIKVYNTALTDAELATLTT